MHTGHVFYTQITWCRTQPKLQMTYPNVPSKKLRGRQWIGLAIFLWLEFLFKFLNLFKVRLTVAMQFHSLACFYIFPHVKVAFIRSFLE